MSVCMCLYSMLDGGWTKAWLFASQSNLVLRGSMPLFDILEIINALSAMPPRSPETVQRRLEIAYISRTIGTSGFWLGPPSSL